MLVKRPPANVSALSNEISMLKVEKEFLLSTLSNAILRGDQYRDMPLGKFLTELRTELEALFALREENARLKAQLAKTIAELREEKQYARKRRGSKR